MGTALLEESGLWCDPYQNFPKCHVKTKCTSKTPICKCVIWCQDCTSLCSNKPTHNTYVVVPTSRTLSTLFHNPVWSAETRPNSVLAIYWVRRYGSAPVMLQTHLFQAWHRLLSEHSPAPAILQKLVSCALFQGEGQMRHPFIIVCFQFGCKSTMLLLKEFIFFGHDH